MNENVNKLKQWLSMRNLDAALRDELDALLSAYEAAGPEGEAASEIDDRFYRDLEFGTAGMRGVMGAGANRMNVVTVRRASQGFADVIRDAADARAGKAAGEAASKVAIAYDNRRNSCLFAFEAACVFAANGIETYLFDRLSSTPLLSFAVRRLGCAAGVVITASHTPKQYNGYKIYDATGCQCLTEDATRVAARIAATDPETDVKTAADRYKGTLPERLAAALSSEKLLHLVPADVERAYLDAVLGLSLNPGAARDLSVVYTPLNGTGNLPVWETLARAGVGAVETVEEQTLPDPEFTTCPEPNPEKESALELGLALCRKRRAQGDPPDILIATDPDCDRVGVAVLSGGDYVRLSGNRIGVLLLDYIATERARKGEMPDRPVMVTTIVSTPLASVIAAEHGIEARKVLTGFKYIGETINALAAKGEQDRFLFGFEESCGYLSGAHVRDKDGVNAALLICEMAGLYKQRGKTLVDRLSEIGEHSGYFEETLVEFVKPGQKGMEEIRAIMAKARDPKTKDAFDAEVVRCNDYEQMWTPKADVVEYAFADGGRAILRPSGTEPKLKIYLTGKGDTPEAARRSMEGLREELLTVFDGA
ncbi:MAG: phospho-sugar mutase [Clostridiales Family XIII bacterium]|jgi:phosphoglucomutase|nr:phospho-sugar mutase [Clostridiales Family XIII bacterium]